MSSTQTDPRFPTGKFKFDGSPSPNKRAELISVIASTPQALRSAVAGLSEAQLNTPYRDGGWTVRQVVHHVPESHMNAYVRFKLALTEDTPTIKPYAEDLWAKTSDVATAPIEDSLALLDALHARWIQLLRGMNDPDWKRAYNHPDMGRMPLEQVLGLYAWHGPHHVAHITELRKRMGW